MKITALACMAHGAVADGGTLVWKYATPETGPPALVSPILSPDGTTLFTNCGTPEERHSEPVYALCALKTADGALMWKYTTGDRFFTSALSPDGATLIAGGNDNMYALKTADGALAWKYATGGFMLSLPPRIRTFSPDGTTLFFCSIDKQALIALKTADGTLVWKYMYATTGGEVNDYSLSADGATLFIGWGGSQAGQWGGLDALNTANGALVWNYTIGRIRSTYLSPDGATLIASGNYNMYALKTADGALAWKYAEGSNQRPTFSPDGVTLFFSCGGRCYTNAGIQQYALKAADGAPVWKVHATDYYVRSSTLSSDGDTLFIMSEDTSADGDNDDDNLYALKTADGTLVWKWGAEWACSSTPSSDGATLFIRSRDDNVYALKTADGALAWNFSDSERRGYRGGANSRPCYRPTLSPDGATLFIKTNDNVYALKTGSHTVTSSTSSTSALPLGLSLGLGLPAAAAAAFLLLRKRKTTAGRRAHGGGKESPGVEMPPVDPVAAAAGANTAL
jgi:outer membrane protein assembly factor BamB